MGKFCSNCGKELMEGQDVCLGCGKVVSNNINVKKKNNHNGYITTTGIIMIILGVCLIIASGSSDYEYTSPVLMLTLPGLCGLVSGILTLNSQKDLKLLFISGIILFVGAIINFIGILDISIFSILAIIFGIFNIKYSKGN